MIRRPPRSTRTDTLVPYTTLFRSGYILGNLALVEVRHGGPRLRFRFRLFGVNLVEDVGFDPTGQDLEQYPRREMGEILRISYTEVAETGRPFRRRRHRLVVDGRMFETESLLLPLSHDGRREVGRAPCRGRVCESV